MQAAERNIQGYLDQLGLGYQQGRQESIFPVPARSSGRTPSARRDGRVRDRYRPGRQPASQPRICAAFVVETVPSSCATL